MRSDRVSELHGLLAYRPNPGHAISPPTYTASMSWVPAVEMRGRFMPPWGLLIMVPFTSWFGIPSVSAEALLPVGGHMPSIKA